MDFMCEFIKGGGRFESWCGYVDYILVGDWEEMSREK